MQTKIVNGYIDGYTYGEGNHEQKMAFALFEGREGIEIWIDGQKRTDIKDVIEFLEDVSGQYYKTSKDFDYERTEDLSLVILKHILRRK